jgi:hypothetical protein
MHAKSDLRGLSRRSGTVAAREFDREVLAGFVAELQGRMEARVKKSKAHQADQMRTLELKLAELQAAHNVQAAEDRYTSVKLAEHQIAIAELRHAVRVDQAKVIDQSTPLQRNGLN